jgi:hypothetical protein
MQCPTRIVGLMLDTEVNKMGLFDYSFDKNGSRVPDQLLIPILHC